MAHKIRVRPVPHIKRDGTVGTKKDYVVRCKARHKVCTFQKFPTRREAEVFVEKHWEAVRSYRENPNIFYAVRRSVESQPSSGVSMVASIAA